MQERLALTELFENPELLKHPEKAEMELARLKPIIQQLEKVIKERNIEWLFEDLIV
jgi:hypothetical protein